MTGAERAEEAAQRKAVFVGMPAYYESRVAKLMLDQSKRPVIEYLKRSGEPGAVSLAHGFGISVQILANNCEINSNFPAPSAA